MNVSHAPLDMGGVKVTGEYTDKIFKHGHLVDTIEGHNIIVNSFLVLSMLLMKNEQNYAGIQYWAVGSGSPSWDGYNVPPDPSRTDTRLVSEIGRVAIDPNDIVFLDENYDETVTPTNIIKIKAEFGANDCNGSWREFGLFGGNATSIVNSGYMIDKRNHPVLTKTSDMQIERSLRLTIQFV